MILINRYYFNICMINMCVLSGINLSYVILSFWLMLLAYWFVILAEVNRVIYLFKSQVKIDLIKFQVGHVQLTSFTQSKLVLPS